MDKKTTILIATADEEIFSPLKNEIDTTEFDLSYLNILQKIPTIVKKNHPELVIIDLYDQQIDEIDLISTIKGIDPRTEIILIGEYALTESGVEAINLGAYDYFSKPIDPVELAEVIVSIHRKKMIRQEIGELEEKLTKKYLFQGILGKSPQMLNIFSFIRRISKHQTTVIITGETGTGKELVAHAIHNLSQQKDERFVSCNCAALADTLLESELFGHVKGAFTGAHQTKHGIFEYANNGTIFLDEIGDISLLTQTKLLRVLETREIQRVGSNETIKVNVRLISATNKDLEEAVRKNRFRKDLYYRLNVAHVELPSLRDRKEDIPLLCNYFIEKFNKSYNKNIKGVSQPTKMTLLKHDWPGNVRELEHVIERCMSLSTKDFLSNNDLPPNLLKACTLSVASTTTSTASGEVNSDTLDSLVKKNLTLEDLERMYVSKILQKTNGNKVQAAKILGLSRRSLYRKLDKFVL